jgi:hypothetical protein
MAHYQWSSFSHYDTGIQGVVGIESEWMARMRDPLIAKKRDEWGTCGKKNIRRSLDCARDDNAGWEGT